MGGEVLRRVEGGERIVVTRDGVDEGGSHVAVGLICD